MEDTPMIFETRLSRYKLVLGALLCCSVLAVVTPAAAESELQAAGLPNVEDLTLKAVEPFGPRTLAVEERIRLAQVRRRRPGAEAPRRRERQEAPAEDSGGATTPEESVRREISRPKTMRLPYQGNEFLPVPNRWTMLYKGRWYDPYNQNIWKGDLKMFGTDADPWFVELTGLSQTLLERRRVPTPTSITSTRAAGRNDIFGSPDQTFFVQNLLFQTAVIKGNTTFKPPDYEIAIAPIINFNLADVEENGVVRADPSRGSTRKDAHFSLAEALIDIHLGDITDRYDFVSVKAGVQPFNVDFRGFLLNETQPGVRFFGNWDNNKIQWNAAFFHRLQLDANALLPILFRSKREDVWLTNLYWQDIVAKGHTLNFVFLYRKDSFDSRGDNFDDNNFLTTPAAIGNEKPKSYENYYLGFNTDGHFGRLNVNSSLYWTFGSESNNNFADQSTDINAYFAALELSVDIDWIRPKVSFLYASGDDDPFDDDANGWATVFDNPNFAGGENTYWQRQGIPFIGGGTVPLVDRGTPLPELGGGRPQGQRNFVNPGILIFNAGVDFDLTPETVWENNINWLRFDTTAPIRISRQDGTVGRDIGLDISSVLKIRPLLTNNIQVELGYSNLIPGDGVKGLFGDKTYYQFFADLILFY